MLNQLNQDLQNFAGYKIDQQLNKRKLVLKKKNATGLNQAAMPFTICTDKNKTRVKHIDLSVALFKNNSCTYLYDIAALNKKDVDQLSNALLVLAQYMKK